MRRFNKILLGLKTVLRLPYLSIIGVTGSHGISAPSNGFALEPEMVQRCDWLGGSVQSIY
jgi:hypothetical protein